MIEILYQDKHCVFVNKPAGILVHRSPIDRHETVFLMQLLRDQLGQWVYPVHRLDRPTSGVMIFALNPASASYFSQQFQEHQTEKTYHAIVRGWTEEQQTIDYPLAEILDPIADKGRIQPPPQRAITHYRLLIKNEINLPNKRFPTSRFSLLALKPETGRKHQLRRHCKHIFHPIIGDTAYGDLHQNRAVSAFTGENRLLLHAYSLKIQLTDGQWRTVTADYDEIWQKSASKLGLLLEKFNVSSLI